MVRLAMSGWGTFPRMGRFASRGVVAGCSLATTLIKIYLLRRLDGLLERHPRIDLNVYIDDIAIACLGRPSDICGIVADAVGDLGETLSDCGCRLAESKTQLATSRADIDAKLRRLLNVRAATPEAEAQAAVYLGADFAPRRARATWWQKSKRKQRMDKVKTRVGRLRILRAAGGARTRLIASAGLAPQAGYGTDLAGLSNAELLTLRRCLVVGSGPKAQGRSLEAVLLLEGDSAWSSAMAPVVRWAREVWFASTGVGGGFSLPQLLECFAAFDRRRPSTWKHVRGPMAAAWLSLRRVGWQWPSAFTLINEDGVEVVLTKWTPKALQDMLRISLRRKLEERMAARLAAKGWRGADGGLVQPRVSMGPVLKLCRARKHPLEPRNRGCLLAVAAGGLWTQSRLADAGYATSALCPLCKAAIDTEHHRWWHCPASQAARDSIAGEDLQRRARAAGKDSLLFSRGLVEHPDLSLSPPSDFLGEQLMIRCADGDWQDAPFDGCQELPAMLLAAPRLYIDGYCSTAALAERRRAGWAVVWTDDLGTACGKLSGMVPRPYPQTPQAAEFVAGLVSSQTAVQPQNVASDCLNVVKQFGQEVVQQLAFRKKYSGVLLQARAHRGWEVAKEMRKVPTHVDFKDPIPHRRGQERRSGQWRGGLGGKGGC